MTEQYDTYPSAEDISGNDAPPSPTMTPPEERDYFAPFAHREFRYIQDPGHGWIEVPRDLVYLLGLADKISGYSYQHDGFVYLEEDQDAAYFDAAFRWQYHHNPRLRAVYVDHTPIRGYARFER